MFTAREFMFVACEHKFMVREHKISGVVFLNPSKRSQLCFLSVRINNYVSKFTKSSGKLPHNYNFCLFLTRNYYIRII